MNLEVTATLEKETKNFARYKFDEPVMGTIYLPLADVKTEFGEVPQNIRLEIAQ